MYILLMLLLFVVYSFLPQQNGSQHQHSTLLMFKKNKEIFLFFSVFFLTIILGTSANNFFVLWFSMELNLVVFIPILMGLKTTQETEGSIKYFLIQSISSSLFLYSCVMSFLMENSINLLEYIMLTSILMKLGMAPMHIWFPKVMSLVSWKNLFIVSVLQKIIPLFIMFSITFSNWLLIVVSVLNITVGTFGGFSQFCLKKIMAFSSISHMSWLIMSIKTNVLAFLLYFGFYFLLMMELTYFFSKMSLNYLSDLSTKKDSNTLTLIFSSKMFSLGGLPPFMGFYPKMMMIYLMMKNNLIWVPFLLTFMGVISIFIYTRTIFSTLIISFNSFKPLKSEFKLNNIEISYITSEVLTIMLTFMMFCMWMF